MIDIIAPTLVVALMACTTTTPVPLDLSASPGWSGTAARVDRTSPASGVLQAWVSVREIDVHWSDPTEDTGDADEHGDEYDTAEGDDDGRWESIPVVGTPSIDLVALSAGEPMELATTHLPAGTINQVRLVLADSADDHVVLSDGTEAPLKAPSGSTAGLKAKGRVTVDDLTGTTGVLTLTAESDLHVTGDGTWVLHPVLALGALDPAP